VFIIFKLPTGGGLKNLFLILVLSSSFFNFCFSNNTDFKSINFKINYEYNNLILDNNYLYVSTGNSEYRGIIVYNISNLENIFEVTCVDDL